MNEKEQFITQYGIVDGVGQDGVLLDAFLNKMTGALAQGFIPLGGVAVTSTGRIFQAMIRRVPVKLEQDDETQSKILTP